MCDIQERLADLDKTDPKKNEDLSNMQHNTLPPGRAVVPDNESFRAWTRASLRRLGLSPSSYGPELGLGKNTIGLFLNSSYRGVSLGIAALLADDLQKRAAAKGIDLDPLARGGEHG
ncbi:hypothetical protein [Yoonia sp.]|uniref:hypothetical protein n=1 Tax=Yoonia sp. TaxID=2212373 RepID=UPI0025E6EF15|nr:hypothetical protein [Yoonia sp.]